MSHPEQHPGLEKRLFYESVRIFMMRITACVEPHFIPFCLPVLEKVIVFMPIVHLRAPCIDGITCLCRLTCLQHLHLRPVFPDKVHSLTVALGIDIDRLVTYLLITPVRPAGFLEVISQSRYEAAVEILHCRMIRRICLFCHLAVNLHRDEKAHRRGPQRHKPVAKFLNLKRMQDACLLAKFHIPVKTGEVEFP